MTRTVWWVEFVKACGAWRSSLDRDAWSAANYMFDRGETPEESAEAFIRACLALRGAL